MVRSTSAGLNPKRRSSRRVLSYVTLTDFTKGIDGRQDKTAIQMGFAQMCRNVIWNHSTGFYERRGAGPLTYGRSGTDMDPLATVPTSYYNYRRGSETMATFTSQHLVTDSAGALWAGGDFEGGSVTRGSPVPGGPRLAELDGHWDQVAGVVRLGKPTYADWNLVLYISQGNLQMGSSTVPMLRWDGVTATPLGNAFNDDLANPTTGNMVRGTCVAYLGEHLFVANIAGHPNRIHFSFPDQPEAWRTEDWIDVGGSGDEITGLLGMRDMLVVFKRDSTWALLGNSPENFRLILISETIGCVGVGCYDHSPGGGVVYWDNESGLVHFDGKTITPLFEPLRPYINQGFIRICKGVVQANGFVYVATDFLGQKAVPFGNAQNRTWNDLKNAGVTWDSLASQRLTWATFAFDTYDTVWVLPQVGGWTSFMYAHPAAADLGFLGLHRSFVPLTGETPGTSSVVFGVNAANQDLLYVDRFADGTDHWGTTWPNGVIDAWYLTAWLHGGLPGQIKRWKSPRVIQGAADSGDVLVEVYHDFDPVTIRRTLTASVAPPDRPAYSYDVEKPGTVGRAKAVSLRLYSHPDVARQWSVHSLTIPLYPKVLR